MEFRVWLEQQSPWKAKKDDIMKLWASLHAHNFIIPRPIPIHHKGSSYSEDTLRITGTSDFINSILSRIKDLLRYETPSLDLDVTYHQIADKYERPIDDKFVCYIKVRQKKKNLTDKKLDFLPKKV
jgi:hypothetical protein